MKSQETIDSLLKTVEQNTKTLSEIQKILAERLPHTETATASWSKTLERRNK